MYKLRSLICLRNFFIRRAEINISYMYCKLREPLSISIIYGMQKALFRSFNQAIIIIVICFVLYFNTCCVMQHIKFPQQIEFLWRCLVSDAQNVDRRDQMYRFQFSDA